MQPSAMRPRSPARVPCIPRTLAIPRWLWRVDATGFGCSGGSSADFFAGSSRAARRACAACALAVRAAGRGQSAAARPIRRDQALGLWAVHVLDGWAAWLSQRSTPACVRACACLRDVCAYRWGAAQCSTEAAWFWSAEQSLPCALGRACASRAAATAVPKEVRCAARYA